MITRSRSSPNVGRAQPDGAVVLEDVALLAQPLDGALDRAGLVQRVLVEVDVEVDAEAVQLRLDLGEHQLGADRAEHLLLLLARQVGEVAVVAARRPAAAMSPM